MSNIQKIRWTYPHNAGSGYTVIPVPSIANHDIEQHVLQLVTRLKNIDVTLNYDLSNQLRGCLKERLQKAQKQQLHLIYKYMNESERLSKLLTKAPNDSFSQKLRNSVELTLNEITNELIQNLEDLQTKARFINNLKRQNFQYYNLVEYDLTKTPDEHTLERRLIKNYQLDRILCSNDILNSNNQLKLNTLIHQLIEERKTNPNLRLIYADFSYCSFELHDMMTLPLSKDTNKQSLPSPLTERHTSLGSSISNNDVINILLLGETGVGKSTCINALVNYLTFNTLTQAEMNKPVTLIPVSFIIATGHNFNEYLVKFGDFDSSNNEDFHHPGQSVTQYCKSYMFDLKHIDGKKLRIIDTPGFGDTRGLNQDDINMQLILKYINNLTHLNAICFLLKPNASRLHIFFRTCLTQLCDLLGPNARQNIIFCFTNARSTFYTPGNTAPLLRTMLDSLSMNDVPFKKENTFCFDNESFRYLVALQNGIRFNDEEKHEYEMSWSTSVKETNRLINYIHTQLSVYSLNNGWQSVKHAQVEILNMIRPILEGIRNILRNLILYEVDGSNKSIGLHPQAIHRPTTFCISCKHDPFLLNNFWILPDYPHEFRNQCLTCSCESNQHILIDYILSYNILNNSSYYQQNEMNDMLDQLCRASAEFAYFLVNIAHSTKEDPFLIGLMRMIREEKQICTEKGSDHLNLHLVHELEKFVVAYEGKIKKIQKNQKHRDLQMIYKWIKIVCDYPIIREQMAAIRQEREKYKDEPYNFEVSKHSNRQKSYLSVEC